MKSAISFDTSSCAILHNFDIKTKTCKTNGDSARLNSFTLISCPDGNKPVHFTGLEG